MTELSRAGGRLIVVSNRIPVTVRRDGRSSWVAEPSVGGHVTALAPVLRSRGGMWVGGPARRSDSGGDNRYSAARAG